MKKQIGKGEVKQGPGSSVILDLDIPKDQLRTILKAAKTMEFTFEELKYQEKGLLHLKRKVTLEDLIVGAFVLRSLRETLK